MKKNRCFFCRAFFCGKIFYVLFLFGSKTVCGQITELWGLTSSGGENMGVVFKTDSIGNNPQLIYSYGDISGFGTGRSRLIETQVGKLFGTTLRGGQGNAGVIFEYDFLSNSYTKKFDFFSSDGEEPYGSLIEATNGNLYGLTSQGGIDSVGVLFEYDPISNNFQKKVDFTGLANGALPFGSLIQSSNGKLYGLTSKGGIYDKGVLFEYDIYSNVLIKKFDFDSVNGSTPYGDLMEANNGLLYGVTYAGGIYNSGIIFQFDTLSGLLTKLFDMNPMTGFNTYGSLIQANNGKLYGMSSRDSLLGFGALFEFDIATSTYTPIVYFNGSSANAYGSLIMDSNGTMFGLTSWSGGSGTGSLFSYIPGDTAVILRYTFGGPLNGQYPTGTLVNASNGKFYALAGGGSEYAGVIFEFDTLTNLSTGKLSFQVATQGKEPFGSLMQASNGLLYGMTYSGSLYNHGVIFEINPYTNNYSKLFDFSNTSVGISPRGSLLQASNGLFYGLATTYANPNSCLFEFNPINNNYIVKHIFTCNPGPGCSPNGSLIEVNGKLYGMTYRSPNGHEGSIFSFEIATNNFVQLHDFNSTSGGLNPLGSLVNISNKLYGLTSSGGTLYGTLFEYDLLTNVFTKKIDLTSFLGKTPCGDLTLASNGKLYALTSGGGNLSTSQGTIIEYEVLTNTCTRKFSFDNQLIDGGNALGSFIKASNDKLYGLTLIGGAYSVGTLFEYIPGDTSINKKFDFNHLIGANPHYGHLTEVILCANTSVAQTDSVLTANASNALYQWIDCSTLQPIPGGTSQSFVPPYSGNFAVIVTQNSCSDTSFCYPVLFTNTEKINFGQSVVVTPNLTSGVFDIVFLQLIDKKKPISFKVVNAQGEIVADKQLISKENNHFDFSYLSNGIYTCVVNYYGNILQKKLTIIK